MFISELRVRFPSFCVPLLFTIAGEPRPKFFNIGLWQNFVSKLQVHFVGWYLMDLFLPKGFYRNIVFQN